MLNDKELDEIARLSAPVELPIVHYWDGYGNLCNTADGRRNTAKCSSIVFEVTCERCLSNLKKIGKLPTGDSNA